MRKEASQTYLPNGRMSRCGLLALVVLIVFGLSACGSKSVRDDAPKSVKSSSVKRDKPASEGRRMVPAVQGGGYYLDDGPHAKVPADLDYLPDAEPRVEPLRQANLRPYTVMGQRFTPMTELKPFSETGKASWYGRKFHGNATAIGEEYDMYEMTAAHPTLPLPSYARVTNLENDRSVVVRVNDRGPFLRSRVIDLSYAAAHRLNFINAGSAKVKVEVITHDEIRQAEAGQDEAEVADSDPRTASLAVRDSDAFERAVADATGLKLAEAATAMPRASNNQGRGAYLQLGAFSTPDNAEGMMSRARSRLGDFADRLHLVNDGDRYRLQLGPFDSVDEARNEVARVASLLDLRPFVVER